MDKAETIINFVDIYTQMGVYLRNFIAGGFSSGLLLGTVLEFLGYGVFKALSLLNIKS